MSFFKNQNTWIWIIVFIVVIVVIVGMKKCENMSSTMCDTCGSCDCASCLTPSSLLDTAYKSSSPVEHYENTQMLQSQMSTLDNEKNQLQLDMNLMQSDMNKMNSQMALMSKEINTPDTQTHHMNKPIMNKPIMNKPIMNKPIMNQLSGHSDNIHHITAHPAPMHTANAAYIPSQIRNNIRDDECEDDVQPIQQHMQNLEHHEPRFMGPDNMPHRRVENDYKLHEMLNELMRKTPEILNKCTPGLLQNLTSIAKLIGSTEGNVSKLKHVEPSLTKEFNSLNNLLYAINTQDMTCFEQETKVPLRKLACNELERINVRDLQKQVDELEYVNELLKSQKQNFRQMRDLFVLKLKDLISYCDTKDLVKRHLQMQSINVISEILHSLGYIFQDDTLVAQKRMMKY